MLSFMHAPSDGFSPQEVRELFLQTGLGCVCFFAPGKQETSSFQLSTYFTL